MEDWFTAENPPRARHQPGQRDAVRTTYAFINSISPTQESIQRWTVTCVPLTQLNTLLCHRDNFVCCIHWNSLRVFTNINNISFSARQHVERTIMLSLVRLSVTRVDSDRFPRAGGFKQEWGGENKLFSSFMHRYLENGTRYDQRYY